MLKRCSDLIPTGGNVGQCFHAVTNNCQQMALKYGGNFALVSATTCPPGKRLEGGGGRPGMGAASLSQGPALLMIGRQMGLMSTPACPPRLLQRRCAARPRWQATPTAVMDARRG